ncbi:MAG TPA: hypothetical protein VMT62_13740 [Syntrophorhabdaceae bacterium]|nr:hypothetical protein [Syntrophorhabdaceae bacterium]
MKRNPILICSVILALLVCACGKKSDPRPQVLPAAGKINDLTGEVKDGVLFLSFTMPESAKGDTQPKELGGFKVFKACGSCMGAFEPFRDIALEQDKGYTIARGRLYFYDDDLMNGFEYAYRVYPYTKRGTRGDSSNTFTIRWVKPPEAPKDVTATASDARIGLSWPEEEGYLYNVYRYEGNAYPLFPLNSAPLASGLYADSGLTNGKKYTYEVRKLKEADGLLREGEGVKVEATPVDRTAPAAPTMVSAVKTGNAVSITWKENSEKDLAGYNVYRLGAGGSKSKLNRDPIKENSYLDAKSPNERYVSYYVTAVDMAGNESAPSRESIVILKE